MGAGGNRGDWGGWKQAHKGHSPAHAGVTWPEAASGVKEVIPLGPSVCEAWDARPGLSALGQRKERSVPLEFSRRITGPESGPGCWTTLGRGVVTVKYEKSPWNFNKLRYNCTQVPGRVSPHSGNLEVTMQFLGLGLEFLGFCDTMSVNILPKTQPAS